MAEARTGMPVKERRARKRSKDTWVPEDGGVSMQHHWAATRKPGSALIAEVFTRNLQIAGTGGQLVLTVSYSPQSLTALPKLPLHLSTPQ